MRLAPEWGAAVGLCFATSCTAPLAAQESWRTQASWVDGHVLGLLMGPEIRQPVGRLPPPPAAGLRVIATRDWMITGMVGLGVNLDPSSDRSVEGLVYAHVGMLRRLSGALEPRAGFVAVAFLPAGAAGPAARVELLDVAIMQGGWLFDGGLHLAAEVPWAFVCDLFC